MAGWLCWRWVEGREDGNWICEYARIIYAVFLGERAGVSVLALTRSGSVIGAQQALAVEHTLLVWSKTRSLVSTVMNAGRCSLRLLVTVGARLSRSRTPVVSQGRCSPDNEVDRHLVPLQIAL